MKVYKNLADFKTSSKTIVTVGTFDGVHVGHQKLLSTINNIAKEETGESVLLTFSPHPRLVLFPDDNDLKMLTTMNERIDRLERSGLDHLIIHPFSIAFSRITALEYVRDILIGYIGIYKLIIGYDHHFGRNREGNLAYLKKAAPENKFEVIEIPAQEIDDVNVSSTKIRTALERGNVQLANEFLGYEYGVDGVVVDGQHKGRTLGYPTANVKPIDKHKLIPGKGVYAVLFFFNNKCYKGMANIGTRPTVTNSAKVILEVNVFDFDGDLYNRKVRVVFVQRLRDEVKFENTGALIKQMKKDAENTTATLAHHSMHNLD